ncbi:hypothetical protein PUN28_000174 [Cardiocondyla obscurior]|uniref:Uncharacterized protein n=1 Tax=Cardiocondyla obscurior TaxID=286306 RepID=A0AAW2GY23_9HYME
MLKLYMHDTIYDCGLFNRRSAAEKGKQLGRQQVTVESSENQRTMEKGETAWNTMGDSGPTLQLLVV